MKTIHIHEAKTNLSAILKSVSQGNMFLICKNGKPIADLIPHQSKSRLKYHSSLSQIKINYNPTQDLNQDEWGEID